MRGELFEVEGLRARAAQRAEEAALAAAGRAVDDDEIERGRKAAQFRDHETAVGLVTAFEGLGVPADLAQDVRHGAGALAAAPAVDERMPGLGLVAEEALDMLRRVLGEERRAQLLSLERGDLLVHGADLRALGVVEHRRRDCAGDVVLGKLGGRAHIDDGVEIREFHA